MLLSFRHELTATSGINRVLDKTLDRVLEQ